MTNTPLHKLAGRELLEEGKRLAKQLDLKRYLSELPGNPDVCEFCGRTLEKGEGVRCPGHPAAGPDGYVYRRLPCTQPDCADKRAEVRAAYQRAEERGEEAELRQRLQSAGIYGAAMNGLTFKGFDTEWPKEERLRVPLRDMLTKMEAWAQDPYGLVLLSGPYGIGKTRLSVAALRRYLQRPERHGFFLACVEAWDATKALWGAHKGTSIQYRGMAMDTAAFNQRTQRAGLVVVDDMDKVNPSGAWLSWLLSIFNYRFDRRLPTIVTLNTPLNQLLAWMQQQKADPTTATALFSRLQGMMAGIALTLPRDQPDYRVHTAQLTGGG